MMRAEGRALRHKVSTSVRVLAPCASRGVFPGTWHTPTTILVLTAVSVSSQSRRMACTRSALLERRPDLPLCSLRRVRQLCAGNSAMFSSTGLDNAARDTRSLLQTPLKVGTHTRSLQPPDVNGTEKCRWFGHNAGGAQSTVRTDQLGRPGCWCTPGAVPCALCCVWFCPRQCRLFVFSSCR